MVFYAFRSFVKLTTTNICVNLYRTSNDHYIVLIFFRKNKRRRFLLSSLVFALLVVHSIKIHFEFYFRHKVDLNFRVMHNFLIDSFSLIELLSTTGHILSS